MRGLLQAACDESCRSVGEGKGQEFVGGCEPPTLTKARAALLCHHQSTRVGLNVALERTDVSWIPW